MDPLIEEEWTFYQAPRIPGGGVQAVRLPDPVDHFNSPCRGALCVAHFEAADAVEKEALLAHFADLSSEAQDAAARVGASLATPLAFAVLLENRDRPLELVLVAEVAEGGGKDLQAAVGACVSGCPSTGRKGRALLFGPPLWPEDKGRDMDKADKDTYPF